MHVNFECSGRLYLYSYSEPRFERWLYIGICQSLAARTIVIEMGDETFLDLISYIYFIVAYTL